MSNNLTYILIGIIILFFILILCICSSRSTFGEMSVSVKPSISKDSVLIFYAPWCGYCKNDMSKFKEAVKQGNGKVILIDADEPENNKLKMEYGIEGYPTIIKGDKTKFDYKDRSTENIIAFLNE